MSDLFDDEDLSARSRSLRTLTSHSGLPQPQTWRSSSCSPRSRLNDLCGRLSTPKGAVPTVRTARNAAARLTGRTHEAQREVVAGTAFSAINKKPAQTNEAQPARIRAL